MSLPPVHSQEPSPGASPAPVPSDRLRRLAGPAIVVFVAALACVPQLVQGTSCGHDFDFHLATWFDALASWRHGIPYPHWAASSNFGAGEPRFVFYPPISWMLGAALGLLLPWQLVPIVLTFLSLAAIGLASRALARLVLPPGPATLAGCVALASGYALFNAYTRSAFGEMTGSFAIPLVLLFLLRDRHPSAPLLRRALDGSAVPLALAIAATWLSDVPLGVLACYLLAAMALAAAILWHSWAPVLRAAVSTAVGLGLTALYLVPAVVQQRWIDVQQVTDDPTLKVENSWIFARHANPLLAFHDSVLKSVSRLGLCMVLVALAAVYVCWRRKTLPGPRRLWIPLACIAPVVLLLQLPISLPIWALLPKLRYVQFPWRWLVAVQAPMGIFFAAALWPTGITTRWRRIAALASCVLFFAVSARMVTRTFVSECAPNEAVPGMFSFFRSGLGFAGAYEYEPPGADDELVAMHLPFACLSPDPRLPLGRLSPGAEAPAWSPAQGSCQATYDAAQPSSPEQLRLQAVTPRAGYLILRLLRYPAWQIRVNGQLSPVALLPQRDDGLVAVPVPQGPVTLTARWTTTRDSLIGRWLSTLAIMLLVALWFLERKQAQAHLS